MSETFSSTTDHIAEIPPHEDQFIGKWFVPIGGNFDTDELRIKSSRSILVNDVLTIVFEKATGETRLVPATEIGFTLLPIDEPPKEQSAPSIPQAQRPPQPVTQTVANPAIQLLRSRKKKTPEKTTEFFLPLDIPDKAFVEILLDTYEIEMSDLIDVISEDCIKSERLMTSIKAAITDYYLRSGNND